MAWREQIVSSFVADITRITLVADPDGLLTEEKVQAQLREKGFDVLSYDDPIAFRYEYEMRFRNIWDNEEQTDLVIALRAEQDDLDHLPYDLLQKGRCLSFSLADFFPNCQIGVVDSLDRADLDRLEHALDIEQPGRMGTNLTLDFICRHLYHFDATTVNSPAMLLAKLMGIHYEGIDLPEAISQRLIQRLKQTHPGFSDWELEKIIPNRSSFFTFIQERWSIFLSNTNSEGVKESVTQYGLQVSGPVDLPFGHSEVRTKLDNCFVDGLLEQIRLDIDLKKLSPWMLCGVITEESSEDAIHRLTQTLSELEIPSIEHRHQDWTRFALRYSRWIHEWANLDFSSAEKLRGKLKTFQSNLDLAFSAWIRQSFSSLSNAPSIHPLLSHHIPKMLANGLGEAKKSALIVLDGCSLSQWHTIQKALSVQEPELIFEVRTCFSWLPSLTNISRQAIFSGQKPLYFAKTIERTDAEPKLWKNFWVDKGFSPNQIGYCKTIRAENDLVRVFDLCDTGHDIMGIVVDEVDEIMHGQRQGELAMHQQILNWLYQSTLQKLICGLHNRGYEVCITADHGNIEAVGMGRPTQGVLADTKGERVRMYPNETLMKPVMEEYPNTFAWNVPGLPHSSYSLFPARRQSFGPKGEPIVCHGGVSIEEMAIPLIKISRKTP